MKQKDKELLLKDLCARLLYGVKLDTPDGLDTLGNVDTNEGWINASYDIEEVKPYLRLLSSMNEEEKEEYYQYIVFLNGVEKYDWLNAHHFDYRGLIPMDLAIEAPKGMYNIKGK